METKIDSGPWWSDVKGRCAGTICCKIDLSRLFSSCTFKRPVADRETTMEGQQDQHHALEAGGIHELTQRTGSWRDYRISTMHVTLEGIQNMRTSFATTVLLDLSASVCRLCQELSKGALKCKKVMKW